MLEMLDMNKMWAKVGAGISGGPFWKSPAHAPNPSSYKDGIDPSVKTAMQMTPEIKSPFTGKTFSQRK